MVRRGAPRYYVRREGRAFWQPTPTMKAAGFLPAPLGIDGPDAYRLAEEWNRRWDAARRGEAPSPAMVSAELNLSPDRAEELTVYPSRSLGEAFRRYRRTDEWGKHKAPRTREDWWRGWKRIKPVFGDVDPRTVGLEDISAWRGAIEDTVSLREAHRALKIWRALWKVAAAMQYCDRESDPSLGVRNRSAAGRSATWSAGEAVRLFKRAWRMGYRGLAAAIAISWDTQLSPGDVRALRASQVARSGGGVMFFTDRAKTGRPVGGAPSERAMAALSLYLDWLGVELHGDAFIIRNRSGAPYLKNALAEDFRTIRLAEFGEGDRRTLGHDFRRSGAVEAITGDAGAEALAHAMGNTLSASNALFATYVPVNAQTIRAVMQARRLGRRRLRGSG